MGYSPEELLQMGENVLLHLTHPDDLKILQEHLQNLLKDNSNKIEQFEYRFKHKDSSYRWLRTYEVIFKRDREGNPVELLGKTFEITKEKETALALAKREQQLLEAQAIAHIGSYEWNIKENKSTNTKEVFQIFEMDKNQKYEEFMSYVHPEDKTKVQHAIEQSFETGIYASEYRYRKNGKEKVIWSVGRVEFEEGKPSRMMGTVQDVTQIKGLEKELFQKTKQLEASNESLQQFAAVASHDLKEPLRKIAMFTDKVLLDEKEKLSASSIGALQKVQRSSKAMQQMIEDILAFSLAEEGEEKKLYSLEVIINEVAELLDQTIKEKEAQIIYNSLPYACIIPSQFRQLFQNLLANALKFSKKEEPPRIVIECKWLEKAVEHIKPAEKYLELRVQDNGIGFATEAGGVIFELFKRLHSKAQYEGSGLGLAIAKKIVQNHEGIITAQSEPGKGAAFTIVIPQ
jgi:PAS domain S-box-containing protein